MIFTDASFLAIGAALTGLVLVGLWSHRTRRRRLAAFLGGRRALDRVARSDLYRLGVRRSLLLGVAGLALAGAAADPHWQDRPAPVAPVKRVILAVDVSASMQATDAEPTRLARAADVARLLLDDLADAEVGLVLFAGRAYPLAPPTRDLGAIRFLLDGVAPTIASSYDPGTLFAGAIDESMTLFVRGRDSAAVAAPATPAPPAPEEMIVFVSDGDAPEPDEALAEALTRAREAGITVHAVGVGTEEGGGMIMPRGTYQLGGPIVDARGAPGRTRLDEAALRRLTSEADGRYARAERPADLDALGSVLAEPTMAAGPEASDAPPAWAAYDLPVLLGALALGLVLLESLLDVTLPRRSSLRAREAT